MLQPLSRPLCVVLVAPKIPPNTGNIARMCAVTGSRLILIEPLGFSIADKDLRRAGLDYWDKVFVKLFAAWDDYVAEYPDARRFLFSARVEKPIYDADFQQGDHLVFGSETDGLPAEILQGGAGQQVTIPMLPDRRSLNLSTAVGVATYEALRQVCFRK